MTVVCEASAVTGRLRLSPTPRSSIWMPHEPDRIASSRLGALRSRGLRSIVCEGGPGLAAQLVAAGLRGRRLPDDESALGECAFPLLDGQGCRSTASLAHLLLDEAGFYARWSLRAQ